MNEYHLSGDLNTGLAGLMYILKVCYGLDQQSITEVLQLVNLKTCGKIDCSRSLVQSFLNTSYLKKVSDNVGALDQPVAVSAPVVQQKKQEKQPVIDFSSFF